MKMNGSQIIIEALVEEKVDTVFGYPGGSVLNIYDALYKNQDRIRHILTCHEQNAAHAADGYARSTGKVGVCIATSGPGATNLVTGIATAYMDSSPVVFITGNVGRKYIGRDSFQEVDITGITYPITKHNFQVWDINKLGETIHRAFHIAKSGRPGPVLIDIPKDITAQIIDYEPTPMEEVIHYQKFTFKELEEAKQVINESKRPLIFAGGGVILAEASNELRKLAIEIDCPVSTSLMGLGCFDEKDPLSLGMIGMHGTIESNIAVKECDCLIAVGVRFSDRVLTNINRFAANAKIIHIDVDLSEIGKNITPYLGINGDAKLVLDALNHMVSKGNHSKWITYLLEKKCRFINFAEAKDLNPRFLMEEAYRQTQGKTFITTEVGQHQMWACQYFTYQMPRQLITSGGAGTMGFGTGAAIGVQIGNPEATVLHFAGDGSFRMNLTELATIVEYKLPIIIVLVDNQTLGMVRQWQTAFYGKRYSQTDLFRGPDFKKLMEAYNVTYYEAKTQEDYTLALKQALKKHEPSFIHAHIETDDKVLPMIAPGDEIDNFILE